MQTNHPQPDLLTHIADQTFPFITPDGRTFAHIPTSDREGVLTFPVRSDAFRNWFGSYFSSDQDHRPTTHAFYTLCRRLESDAANRSPERFPVYRRTASFDSRIHIDIANPQGDYIEITPDGYRIRQDKAPGAFETSAHTRSLPVPRPPDPDSPPDPLDRLRGLLRIPAGHPWLRCLAWLLSALRSDGPFPILILRGPLAPVNPSPPERCVP